MKNKKKLGILVFVSFIALFVVLATNKGINNTSSGKSNAFGKTSLSGSELAEVKDLTEYFQVVTGEISSGDAVEFKNNVTLKSKFSTDRIPGDKVTISKPVQIQPSVSTSIEPFGFKKLQFVAAGVGSIAETRAQIRAALSVDSGSEPTEFKIGSADSWIILSVLVNKYKYTFSNTQRFSVSASINFDTDSSYANIKVNQVLPIGYVKPYPDWGYTFQQYIDYGTDAQFNGNVDFRGNNIVNLHIVEDVSTYAEKGAIGNYQVDSIDTLKKVGYFPFATIDSINIPYGANRNHLSIGLFGLYGGSYITGGSLEKSNFITSYSKLQGTLPAELVDSTYVDEEVNQIGTVSFYRGTSGISLMVDQGLLIGQASSNVEISGFDFTGTTISNTALSNTGKFWEVNKWEDSSNHATNLMIGNAENETTYVADMGTVTATSTIGGTGFYSSAKTSITGNAITSNWGVNMGVIGLLKGYFIIKDITIDNGSPITQINLGTEGAKVGIPTLNAGFFVGYTIGGGADSELSNISVKNFKAEYYQDMTGVLYYGSLFLSHTGGLFGRVETAPQIINNITLNEVDVVSEMDNRTLRNSRFNVNENFTNARVYGDTYHTAGILAGTFYTVNRTDANCVWQNINFIDSDLVFNEKSTSFDYSSPSRIADQQYGTGLIGTAITHSNAILKDVNVDSASSVTVLVQNQNYGAPSVASPRFSTLLGRVGAPTSFVNIVNNAPLNITIRDSILSGNQYYRATDGGTFFANALGDQADGKRVLENIVNNGNINILFDATDTWKGTFTNKGRTYDSDSKPGKTYNFAANMANADSEFYVSALLHGWIAISGGHAENIINRGNIVLEFVEQQVSVRAQQADAYIDATAGSLSCFGGISSYGVQGDSSYANLISNYGNIYIGGKGITEAAYKANPATEIATAYGSGRKVESRNINGADTTGFGWVWGGIYNKLGVNIGGLFARYIVYGPASATNLANYGDVMVYSTTLSGFGGISGTLGTAGTGTSFIGNIVNYANITAVGSYYGWNNASGNVFGLSAGSYMNDRARIAGIIGAVESNSWTNVQFFTNLMNYGNIRALDQRTGELDVNGNKLTDNFGSILRIEVADLIGGCVRYGTAYIYNGDNLRANHLFVLNAGARPTKVNGTDADVASYSSNDTNYVAKEGQSISWGKDGTQLAFGSSSGSDPFVPTRNGYYLFRGGFFSNTYATIDQVRQKYIYSYTADNMETSQVESGGPAIYLKVSTESSGNTVPLANLNASMFVIERDGGNRYFGNYYNTAPSLYASFKVANVVTTNLNLEKYFNGFINGVKGDTWQAQIYNYKADNQVQYATDNLIWEKGSIILSNTDSSYSKTPRALFNLTTDEMMIRGFLPHLYGYPFIGSGFYNPNPAYTDKSAVAKKLLLWSKAASNITVNGKIEIAAGQYYFGDSPLLAEGKGTFSTPTTNDEINSVTFEYSPTNASADRALSYAKLVESVNSLIKTSSQRYVLTNAKYYLSRDNINWVQAKNESELNKLVIGGYYVRVEIPSVAATADNPDTTEEDESIGLKGLSVTSTVPLIIIKTDATINFIRETSQYKYTDKVYLYGDDLYEVWRAYYPIYTYDQFISEVSDYNAIKINGTSDKLYKDLINVDYRQATGASGSYSYPTTWTGQTIPSGYFPNGFIAGSGAGVRNVLSIENLRAGHYQIRLTFNETAPSYNNFFVTFQDNSNGGIKGVSRTEVIYELDILPREITLDWGVLNSTNSDVIQQDPNELIYQNSDFNIGTIFHKDIEQSLNSSIYGQGISFKYTNKEKYTFADPEVAIDPNLIGTNKPLDYINVGTHTVSVQLFKGSTEVTSDYAIDGSQLEFSYTIKKRSLVLQWQAQDQFKQHTGSEIEVSPVITEENLYQLVSVNVNNNLTGLVYNSDVAGNNTSAATNEGKYFAKLIKIVDDNSYDITTNINIENRLNGSLIGEEGFAWRIIPSSLVISSSVSQISFGTKIVNNDFNYSVSADGIEYKNVAYNEWSLLPTLGLTLVPGTYEFRSFLEIDSEKVASSSVRITVVKADFNYSKIINLEGIEEGSSITTAGALKDAGKLPINKNGEWTLETPSQVITSVGSHQIQATLIPNNADLYNPLAVTFVISVIGSLDELEFKEDSTLVSDQGYLNGLEVSKTITLVDLRKQISNINGVEVYSDTDVKVTSDTQKLGSGYYILFKGVKTEIVIYGDTNGDGEWSLGDTETIYNHTSGDITLSGAKLLAADITNDGRVNALDLVASILVAKNLETVATVRPTNSTVVAYKKDENL